MCALVGQNGAGKSTLMSILAGAMAPDAGSDDARRRRRTRRRIRAKRRRAGVAMIYQELSLAPHLSVMDNIALGVEPREADRSARSAWSIAGWPGGPPAMRSGSSIIQRFPIEALVGDLPPAAQQLVEIARALATGCRVLVLDEPTSSLAQDDVRRLFEPDRAAQAAGSGDRLHLALHRGSDAGVRSVSPCCATGAMLAKA